jgi:hypothetical protein
LNLNPCPGRSGAVIMPSLICNGSIQRIGALRDNPFRLERVRVLPHGRAIDFYVLAEIEPLGGFFYKLLQHGFALNQRQSAQILAAAKQNVEGAE